MVLPAAIQTFLGRIDVGSKKHYSLCRCTHSLPFYAGCYFLQVPAVS